MIFVSKCDVLYCVGIGTHFLLRLIDDLSYNSENDSTVNGMAQSEPRSELI